MTDADCNSVCSSGSVLSTSQMKMECPYCNKDFQIRSLFKHIFLNHFREFRQNTTSKWIQEAENNYPLRVWWDVKNDFDEDECKQIFVCLGTQKTFMTEARATAHFKKDKAALKKHNAEIKKLKKDIEKDKIKEKKETDSQPWRIAYDTARRTNDPSLCRALWSSILFDKKICDFCVETCKRRNFSDDTVMFWKKNYTQFEEVVFSEWVKRYDAKVAELNQLMESKCLDYQKLQNLELFFWNFWSDNAKESIPFFESKLNYATPDSIVNDRAHGIDLFLFSKNLLSNVDPEYIKKIKSMPACPF